MEDFGRGGRMPGRMSDGGQEYGSNRHMDMGLNIGGGSSRSSGTNFRKR